MNTGLQQLAELLGPRPMVQLVFITIGNVKYALIGPVVPDRLPVTEIEFADLIPLDVAARMLSGNPREFLGENLQ